MTVHAPYAFAPIARFVHVPAWADRVTHDLPFRDGLSGTITLSLTARTPLLVGGPRSAATPKAAGEVWPVRLPDGTYAIPGSSLQGLVRSIVDVAAFGKLGPSVQKRRYGVRDLSGTLTSKAIYQERISKTVGGSEVAPQAKSGWLIETSQGRVIVPCRMARIRFDQIAPSNRGLVTALLPKSDAPDRYQAFLQGKNLSNLERYYYLDPDKLYPHQKGRIKIRYQRAFADEEAGRTPVHGTLVFTGKASGSDFLDQDGRKKFEFLFHSPRRLDVTAEATGAMLLSDDVWDDFLLIHGKQPGRPANPNWAFWESEYEAGRPIPIFYLWEPDPITRENRITTIGTAYMFKVAHRLSTHDLLRHSTPDHLDPDQDPADPTKPYRMDLGSLIFGTVADRERGRGLKRRAAFDLARATTTRLQTVPSNETVLLSPKPSYYPSYVRQPKEVKSAKGVLYATYTAPETRERVAEIDAPELAGVKIWPSASSTYPKLPLPPDTVKSKAATIRLHALPAGTAFRTALRVHNLRPVELGAVLWALSFGDRDALSGKETPLRHSLGLGKPYQMGQVEIRVTGTDLMPNDPAAADPAEGWAAAAVAAFEAHMAQVYAAAGGTDWATSVQVAALRKAADPRENEKDTLRYMPLGDHGGGDGTYIGERGGGGFLAPYAGGHEIPRGTPAAASVRARPAAPPAGAPLPRPATVTRISVGSRVRLKSKPESQGVVVSMTSRTHVKVQWEGGKTQPCPTALLELVPTTGSPR